MFLVDFEGVEVFNKNDKKALRQYIESQIDKALLELGLWYIDIERMSKLTCMSKRFLEEEIVKDPRMRVIEIRKTDDGKRWWPYQEAFETMREITSKW
ncbi:hypothetical protein P9B03_02285 [Metasolibacillus meyeri]|uniref:DUF771 domain-containing protein n=1 Tax=Metasolibacillus meyeri TaxID=1071052 RepID=A0AAW9NNJ1_9BACL|nr:hypothetical protein [Metasolibacillus meyeri]MEC1177299.1 hypothetical protein [Metasolibacillus meyeri]